MVSHVVDVLLQGVFASLTGGWFFNLHNDLFVNTVHMYLWIVLALMPLLSYITLFNRSLIMFTLYASVVTVLFTISKCVNMYLHNVFRAGEVNQEEETEEEGQVKTRLSTDSINMPPGSSNANMRGSLPNTDDMADSITSNFFDRNRSSPSNSQSTSHLDDDRTDQAGPSLPRDENSSRIRCEEEGKEGIMLGEVNMEPNAQLNHEFRVHLLRHMERPLVVLRGVLQINRGADGQTEILMGTHPNYALHHRNIEPDITSYKKGNTSAITWSTRTANKLAIYTAFFDTTESFDGAYNALLNCVVHRNPSRGPMRISQSGTVDSDRSMDNVLVHKSPGSERRSKASPAKHRSEHILNERQTELLNEGYLTGNMGNVRSEFLADCLDPSNGECGGSSGEVSSRGGTSLRVETGSRGDEAEKDSRGTSADMTSSNDNGSTKEDPTYAVLCFSEPSDSRETNSRNESPSNTESGPDLVANSDVTIDSGDACGSKDPGPEQYYVVKVKDSVHVVRWLGLVPRNLADAPESSNAEHEQLLVQDIQTNEILHVDEQKIRKITPLVSDLYESGLSSDNESKEPKRKAVCRTDNVSQAHDDFMSAFLDNENTAYTQSPNRVEETPPTSPGRGNLRAMKTIAVMPDRAHPEFGDRVINTLLRESRSLDIGTESPVNVTLRRQSQLAPQRRPTRALFYLAPETPQPNATPFNREHSSSEASSSRQRHYAVDHGDTSAGAIHTYIDENGKAQTYMFDAGEDSTEPLEVEPPPVPQRTMSQFQVSHSYWADNNTAAQYWSNQPQHCSQLPLPPLPVMQVEWLPSADTPPVVKPVPVKPTSKQYMLKLLPCFKFRIDFDRLHLERLLDEDKYLWLAVLKVVLAVSCSLMVLHLLSSDVFHGIEIPWLCVVLAGCQFCLIKSVQPDSSSPTQGFNHITPISRPIYFLLLGGVLVGLNHLKTSPWHCESLYGVKLCSARSFELAFITVKMLLMLFPAVFLFGLLPQINTFLLFTIEQVDIHIFGGNACHSLTGAFISLSRSLLTVAILYGFTYAAFLENELHTTMWFPVMLALAISLSYHLSRTSGNVNTLWRLIKRTVLKVDVVYEECDSLPRQCEDVLLNRCRCDVITCTIIGVITFAVVASTVFYAANPHLVSVMQIMTVVMGIIVHYFIPHLRKSMPWLWFLNPCLKSKEHHIFEVQSEAKAMWFEKMYLWTKFAERNVLYPLLFLAAIFDSVPTIKGKFGVPFGAMIISIVSVKLFRHCYSYTPQQYKILLFTMLFFQYDFRGSSETFPVDYFCMSIAGTKIIDLMLKLEFLLAYIAPWQIVWGSAVHAFAQPFSIPHSGFLFLQAFISALFSAPLSPLQGSALFIIAYVRPLKFWEKDYNTRRIDSSNTRLATALEHTFDTDQNNFNSIFYEHLGRSLQKSLCGDILMGRWGNVTSGDCFIIASDYLNALVHVVEVGNGLVTFQLRGLEFKGTFCQMREVEAITEDDGDDKSCFCCEPGHAPGMLSVNAAFNRRWLAWEVMCTKYVVEGYSITKNSATGMLQMFELRKMLMKYYIKCILYYVLKHAKLAEWTTLFLATTQGTLLSEDCAVERGALEFSVHIDIDYDIAKAGISRKHFLLHYQEWISLCIVKRDETASVKAPALRDCVTLCYGLSLLARRALSSASPNKLTNPNAMLCGIHALLKNDIRISSSKDDWVFQDMDILKEVVSPAIRMSLKLYQDHLVDSDQYADLPFLHSSINSNFNNTVVAHEGDPAWRNAILNNAQSLLTLRHVLDDTSDEYSVFTLNKRFLSFRIIKVNRECVRGLWAGQQQELIFLRNTNPERGSIQNAKQALRNMINSSCDQPIGYPIYVSPLITSYSDTHPQVASITGMVKHYTPCLSSVRRLITRILNCGIDSANSIDADNARQNDNFRVLYRPNHRTVTLPCDNKPVHRAPSGSFHSSLDFGSNDPVSQESDASPVHHRSSGQSDSSKKSESLGCVAASDPILSCAQGLSMRREQRYHRQHRSFLSGRAESTSAADKSQEILPPQNLRNAPQGHDNENLNKVPLSSRCLLDFNGRGKMKSSSASLPSNTSLHDMINNNNTAQSDNALHVERKTSRELLTKATSDLNFNPIIEVNLKSPITSDEDSQEESTPLLVGPDHKNREHNSQSAPNLPSDKRRVDFAATDIEIPNSNSSLHSSYSSLRDGAPSDTILRSSLRESNMRSAHDSVCSNISLCNDTGYSVDVGVQADRADSPCLTRTGSAPSIRQHSPCGHGHRTISKQDTIRSDIV